MIGAKVEFNVAELRKQLDRLPGLMQKASFEKGLRPASKVVQKRVKELIPRSNGSRDKWSESTKQARRGEKPLWKKTKIKIFRGDRTSLGLVGLEWPDGNIGHVVMQSEKGHSRKVVLWGRRTGRTIRRKDVFKRAFDETKKEAAAAWTAAVSKDVDNKLRTLGRG